MAVTMAQVLQIGDMTKCKLLAGKQGLNRKISYTGNMEIPDISPWLFKEFLLVTSGYALRNSPNAITALVQDLYDNECSGLVLKTRFTGPVPEEALNLADQLGVPIVEMPADIPLSSVTNPLTIALADTHNRQLEISRNIQRKFLDLQINGGGHKEICEMISNLISASVIITDPSFKIVEWHCSQQLSPEPFEKIMQEHKEKILSQTESIESGSSFLLNNKNYIMRKILLRRNLVGYIFIELFRPPEDIDLTIADHAVSVIALEFAKIQALQEQYRMMENNFFIDIISGNIKSSEQAEYRAKNLGWPTAPFCAAMLDVASFTQVTKRKSEHEIQDIKENILKIIENSLEMAADEAYAIILKNDDFICLLPENIDESKIENKVIKAINRCENELGLKLTAGIHCNVKSYIDLCSVYTELCDAIIISRSIPEKGCCVNIEKARFEQALLHVATNPYFENFVIEKIEKLAVYDEKNETYLLHTLEKLIENMGNRTLTAQNLFMHRNTLTYRLKRIEAIVKCDLNNYESYLSLGIALKAYRYIRLKK